MQTFLQVVIIIKTLIRMNVYIWLIFQCFQAASTLNYVIYYALKMIAFKSVLNKFDSKPSVVKYYLE